jgi:hypothetical protein
VVTCGDERRQGMAADRASSAQQEHLHPSTLSGEDWCSTGFTIRRRLVLDRLSRVVRAIPDGWLGAGLGQPGYDIGHYSPAGERCTPPSVSDYNSGHVRDDPSLGRDQKAAVGDR